MGAAGNPGKIGRHILETKSKVKWLQEGEKNTKFFHNSVIQDRHSSRILKLKKMEGVWIELRCKIEEELNHYFAKILNEYLQDRERDIAHITGLISPLVTREDNEMLVKLVTLQEVEEAVNQMALGKAPGSDGFTSNFFHYFWDMVKEEVVEIVEESRKKGGAKSFQCNVPFSHS